MIPPIEKEVTYIKILIITHKQYIKAIGAGILLILLLLLVAMAFDHRKAPGGYATLKYFDIKSISIIDSKGKTNDITEKEMVEKIINAVNTASLSNKSVDVTNKWHLKIISKKSFIFGINYDDKTNQFEINYGDMNKNKGGILFVKSKDLYKYAVKPYFNK